MQRDITRDILAGANKRRHMKGLLIKQEQCGRFLVASRYRKATNQLGDPRLCVSVSVRRGGGCETDTLQRSRQTPETRWNYLSAIAPEPITPAAHWLLPLLPMGGDMAAPHSCGHRRML